MTNIKSIEGTITLTDGTTSQFSMADGFGWQQWGATQSRLGLTVDVLQAISAGLEEADIYLNEDDDESDDEDATEYSYGEHELGLR